MSKRRVMVSCSAKGGVPWWWFESYDKTLRLNHPDFEFEFAMEAGNSAINLTRNIVADNAIEQGYWKLVQIDKDQFWTPEQLIRLTGHDLPIVAGPYCKKKSGPVEWLAVAKPGAVVGPDGLLPCDFVATGMLATSVEALKQMVAFYPDRRFVSHGEKGDPRDMTELFPIGIVGPNTPAGRLARIKKVLNSGLKPESAYEMIRSIVETLHPGKSRMLGEDYHFCHLARKAGLEIFCDTKCAVGHVGDAVFPIGPEALSSPQGIPTHSFSLDDW